MASSVHDQNTNHHNNDIANINKDVNDIRASYLLKVGCTCDFDLLRSSKSSEEFQQHLLKVERISSGKLILNGTMLEFSRQLRTHRNSQITRNLFFQFIKAVVPENVRGDIENQNNRQFNLKLRWFLRQYKRKQITHNFPDFLNAPYNFRISEKAKKPPSSEDFQKSRDLIEEAERDVKVEILTSELEEVREKLMMSQSDNAALVSRLKETEGCRDGYKMDLERLKKENFELRLRMNFSSM